MDKTDEQIQKFLSAPAIAVVGASNDPEKYGHKCYLCLLNYGRKAYPVNPRATEVLGNPAFPDLASLPEKVESVSIITPPAVTEKVINDAIAAGVKNVWMQPGAESPAAVKKAEKAGLNVIWGGPCLLVVMATIGRRR
ncbi:MAG TPA: CoA-binding protein [Planctomycetota bacterium]|nr:CoA-binding protein [Planctomycetota bacterium]